MPDPRPFNIGDAIVVIQHRPGVQQWPPAHTPGVVVDLAPDNRVVVEFATLFVRRSNQWIAVKQRIWTGLLRHADEPVPDR